MMLREPHIKAAVIDALFKEGFVDDDAVLISELPVAGWSRRADLVLANGRLIAFEIKSQADSLQRLEAQVKAYQGVMEGVTVVADPRHAHEILKAADSTVGVFQIEAGSDGAAQITLLRKPHIRPLSLEASIKHMLAADLKRLVRANGEPATTSDRHSLEILARNLPVLNVRKAAIAALKQRYLRYHARFLSERVHTSSLIALKYLRRPSWQSAATASHTKTINDASFHIVDLRNIKITPRKIE
ncbi:sce7726 family protein [Ancylobacter terrae]|uniref:sce7726 family protein n=1 Tax=Ancylobacter sp. sgz301288 TaxID=3342077 RepID=UPI00385F10C2